MQPANEKEVNRLTRAGDMTRPAALRKGRQLIHLGLDLIVDPGGGPWAIGFDVVEDGLSVRYRKEAPDDLHP